VARVRLQDVESVECCEWQLRMLLAHRVRHKPRYDMLVLQSQEEVPEIRNVHYQFSYVRYLYVAISHC